MGLKGRERFESRLVQREPDGPNPEQAPGCFLTKKRAVFILSPTSVRIWHKAVFKVGPVADSSKNASDPVGIPLFGAPQAPDDKPNPFEEG